MSLLKSKQIDLSDLAAALGQVITQDSGLILQWAGILNTTLLSAVFSLGNGNISNGQSNFIITYAYTPTEVFVYRNGIKQVKNVDFTVTPNGSNFTVTLTEAVSSSTGANFSETIEILYY